MKIKSFKMLLFAALTVFLGFNRSFSQNAVFAFFEYNIKNGMEDSFANGYAKDLEWQQSQGDEWSWVAWFVLNGDRRGRFVDATPNHAWGDFDNWNIDGSENARHNKIHWLPYVEKPSGSYKEIMEEYSIYDKGWLKSKYLQVYRIQVKIGQDDAFLHFLTGMKPLLKSKLGDRPFVWMRTVSGGDYYGYRLLVALDKIEDLKLCDGLFGGVSSKKGEYGDVVEEVMSELWGYSDKLSLFPEEK